VPFYGLADIAPAHPAAGIERRAVYLKDVMLTFFEFEDGAAVPRHNHPHEQITYVIRGSLEFTLDGETRLLHAGEGASVPAGVAHNAVARGKTAVLDGWSPIREDYK
jgi:quercetin dioxygenase-like cupin family protein